MRKGIWQGGGKVGFVEDQAPPPPLADAHSVRIRVTAAGVCGTDVHIIQGKVKFADPPLVLGHEFAGVVEECGLAVTRVKPGQRVKCDSVCGCGACAWCWRGATQFCPAGSEFGITRDGGWAEWVVAPECNLHLLPDAISDDVAAIMDVEVLGSLRKPGVAPGDTVVVLGPGPAGLIALQAARAFGAGRVIVCGTRPERLRLAKELGADHVIDVNREDAVKAVRDLTKGEGAGLVFEAAGTRKSAIDAMEAVRAQGKIVFYGVHGAPLQDFPIDRIVLKDVVVYGALTDRTGWDELISMVAERRINLARLVTHRFPLEEVEAAYRASADRGSGCLKAVLSIYS
ncbi:MAG: zinc-binding dehydrogenase [Bryobacteraceae bacterium]